MWKTIFKAKQVKKESNISRDLTYDFFSENLKNNYCFQYKNKIVEVSNFQGGIPLKKIFEVTISEYFDSSDELLKNARIDGKTFKEIWEDLESPPD